MTYGKQHIKVILPLKLGWEPLYSVPEDSENLKAGDRVFAPFAGRSYLGVVSDANPGIDGKLDKVVQIFGKAEGKAGILPEEIQFWREIAKYYMCTVGEVYKAAYPYVKDEIVSARKSQSNRVLHNASRERPTFSPELTNNINRIIAEGRPLLLHSSEVWETAAALCLERLSPDEEKSAGDILWLVPETKPVKVLETNLSNLLHDRLLSWNVKTTPSAKRLVLKRLREENCPHVVLGTRSALFLPFKKLQLVIISDEQDSSYKQYSPSPRYNGRDAAMMLARQHGAAAILCSSCPSLESSLNSITGKYSSLRTNVYGSIPGSIRIIDTRSEARKNGMIGDISRKLVCAISQSCGNVVIFKPRRATFPTMEDLGRQFSALYPSLERLVLTDDLSELDGGSDNISLLAIFGTDALLGRTDFRADEKALQILHQTMAAAKAAEVVIQTKESSHPIFRALLTGDTGPLLAERKEFGYPPFCRMVNVMLRDSFTDRLQKMKALLHESLRGNFNIVEGQDALHCLLPKDGSLLQRKEELARRVDAFEKEQHYRGHIFFDVDPL